VPQEASRTGKIPPSATEAECGKASLFWDNPRYALGLVTSDKPKAAQHAEVCHDLFRLRHAAFARDAGADVAADPGMQAMLRFLDRGAARELTTLNAALPEEIQASIGNVAFQLDGDSDLICRRSVIRAAISAAALDGTSSSALGQCLVSGKTASIARLHPAIQGVAGAQSSGAYIASFNQPAFESYGLVQGANAPMSAYAAFAYTTALNNLLHYGSQFRAQVGASTVVFWAGEPTANEPVLCELMAGVAGDDPWRNGDLLARLYRSPRAGTPAPLDDPTPFYVLGLSAESRSRLTVRFFHAGTIALAGAMIRRWFDELGIAPADGAPLSMTRLRRAVSVQGDLKNAPPLLEAELLHAAYTGGPLPQRVLAEALIRCAAEGVTRERAALIKAFLNRNQKETFTVGMPGWGGGFATNRRKDIEAITGGLPPLLPHRLTLLDQGSFAIGYWHQSAQRRNGSKATTANTEEQAA
jgi:CRISPR-associated protein Csd1